VIFTPYHARFVLFRPCFTPASSLALPTSSLLHPGSVQPASSRLIPASPILMPAASHFIRAHPCSGSSVLRTFCSPGRSSADLRRSLSSVRSAPLDLSPLAKQLKTATQEDIRDRIQQLTLTRDLLVRPGASEEDTRDARILEIKIAASEAMLTDLSLDRVESTYAPRREVTELWPQRAPEHAVAGVAPKLVESNGGPLLQRRFISGPSTASSASDAITANEAPYDEDQREDGCDEDSDDFVTIPVGPVLNAAVIEPHSTHSVPLVATLFEGFGTLHEHEGTQYGRRVKAVPLHALISANEDESCSMSISGLPDMEDVLSGRFGTRMSAPTLNSPPGEDAPSARVTRTPIMPRTVARKSPRPIHINISTRPGRQEPEITLSTPRQVSPQPGAYLWDRILTWG